MTNLEWLMLKNKVDTHFQLCEMAYSLKEKKKCDSRCEDCTYRVSRDIVFGILLEEHKEPIKLKQWEKDLLEISDYQETRFDFYTDLRNMKKRGYFEGITDTNMGIKEILENCEVEDR